MYHKGGYIGHFLSIVPLSLIQRLTAFSLHVDVMRETFADLWFPCPVEDLRYSVENLAEANFETFIQVQLSCFIMVIISVH